jgi:GntR family transcriptional repressor for pyruvate dehydrogenase complex
VEPIERRKVYELVAERLSALIVERGLRPGDPLPTERELMRTFHVGRSSVREALRMLESRGMIKPSGNGAFGIAEYGNPLSQSLHFLVSLEEASLLEIYEVRQILEVEAAALAAARRTDADLAQMAEAIAGMVDGLASEDRYIAADLRFHLAVAAASRNRVALGMMHAVRDLLQRALAHVYHVAGSPARSITQHRVIFDAIRAQDVEAARLAMRDHLRRVELDIRTILATRPRPVPAGAWPRG